MRGIRTQQCRMSVGKVSAVDEKVSDRRELVSVESLQQCGRIFADWIKHLSDGLHSFHGWAKDLLPPVLRVRFALQVSGLLQPGDYAGDGASS